MTAVLVTLQQLKDYLGETDAQNDEVLRVILDETEALFLRKCGRSAVPFSAAQTARVEKQRGTESAVLHLDYPIAALTSVVLGFDTAAPDETLTVADKKVLIYEVGKAHLTRVDGGAWGRFGAPAYVHVTYNAQAELPEDAALAVMLRAAGIFRQRSFEGMESETVGGQQATIAKLDQDPGWLAAIENHRREPL
jgi:hypothetical protein